jgi:ubiquinone/menaquinone biosynthesis C-methylase UbiE
MSENTDSWEDFWQNRDQSLIGKLLTWGRRNLVNIKLEKYILENTSKGVLVEAGCGSGEITLRVAAKRGDLVVLVDRSQEALKLAKYLMKQHKVNGQVIQCDIAELSSHVEWSEDNTVYNIGVVEHFKDPAPILREMLRVSGQPAIAIIPERSLFWLWFYKVSCILHLLPPDFFVQYFTSKQLSNIIWNAGLQVVWVRRTCVLGIIPYLGVCFTSKE